MARESLERKAVWNTVAWFATTANGFVVAALIFREIGAAAFGVWATVFALRAFLLMLDAGLALGVSRDVALLFAEGPASWGRVRGAWRLYAGLGCAALAIGVACQSLPGLLLGVGGELAEAARLVTLATAAEAAVALFFGPLNAILRGHQRFDALACATAALAVVGLGLVVAGIAVHGLVGAAFGALTARVVVQAGQFWWMRRRGYLTCPVGDLPASPRPKLRSVVTFAAPLWISAVGVQLGLMTDVPLVGAFFGEERAGHFALGARLPAACAGLMFAIIAASFPRYVAASSEKRRVLGSALLVLGCSLAASGFGFLIICAEPILEAWVGAAPPLGVEVLCLYALVWTIHAPAHVLSSMTIALGRHRVLGWVVFGSISVNLALSVFLTAGGNPAGPALGSLCAIAVSNLVVVPALLLPRIGWTWPQFLRPVLIGLGAGTAVSGAVFGLERLAGLGPLGAVALGAAATIALAGVVLDLTIRTHSTLGRLWTLARRGGFRVLRRQRAECRDARRRLAASAPALVWTPQAPPLVTVRIPTYDRGRLVAERAIASALAQTHDNLEVVVVGDCCDDATAAAVRSVDDPRVRFVNLPERGRYPEDPELRWMVAGSAPMNHGVEIARGDWIAPLDDDDELLPDHVESLLRACYERQLDFAYGIAETEEPDGSWSQRGSWPLQQGAIVHSAVLYSARFKEIRHDLESWRIDAPGDWNLWCRLRAAGARIGFVDRVVARHYRERRGIADAPPIWVGRAVGEPTANR